VGVAPEGEGPKGGEPVGEGPKGGEPVGGEPAGSGEPAAERPRRVPFNERPIPEPMPRRHVAIVAVFVAILYAVGMIARGEVLAGIVGGVLAGILLFLVFREVGERQWRRIRAREAARRR
jgi:hypothetical protein